MIDSVSQSQGAAAYQNFASNSLSQDQSAAVNDILSNYDPENLSADDAKEIAAQFKEQGIKPSRDLKSTLESSGFDAKQLANLAGIEKPSKQQITSVPGQSSQSLTSTFSVTA